MQKKEKTRKMKYITKKDIKLPKRKKESHKGDNGYVLVIGGSRNYVGAPYLAAKAIAALRSGCDLVTVASPEKTAWAINCLSPDLITYKLKGDNLNPNNYNGLVRLINHHDVILIGNGIDKSKETMNLILRIINYIKNYNKKNKIKKLTVIDADALKMIKLKDVDNAVLTPHKGELEILLKNNKIQVNLKNYNALQKHLNNNILLIKSRIDVILSKDKIKYNKTGNEGMTVGGTGDILAGLVAGYISQGLSLFDAACTAAYFNGLVGDRLKKKQGYSFIASDFLKEIGVIIKQ